MKTKRHKGDRTDAKSSSGNPGASGDDAAGKVDHVQKPGKPRDRKRKKGGGTTLKREKTEAKAAWQALVGAASATDPAQTEQARLTYQAAKAALRAHRATIPGPHGAVPTSTVDDEAHATAAPEPAAPDRERKKRKKDRKSEPASRESAGGAAAASTEGDAYRSKHSVRVEGVNLDADGAPNGAFTPPEPVITLAAAPFRRELVATLLETGFDAPTPIQAQSWPVALLGRDIICVARTGSGKTAGFLFPLLQMVRDRADAAPKGRTALPSPFGLVLAPTRELAQQTHVEALRFGKGVRSVCIYGGIPMHDSVNSLRGAATPQLIVATPRRLIDLCKYRKISLGKVTMLVLDEADRMLDMGFKPQLEAIIQSMNEHRTARAPMGPAASRSQPHPVQTLFYSATWPVNVQAIAATFLREHPIRIFVGGSEDALIAHKRISQEVRVVRRSDKHRLLSEFVAGVGDGAHKTLVFVAKKTRCDELTSEFKARGLPYGVDGLHGDRLQHDRADVMARFKDGRVRLLFATDVAARGLDVTDITCVVNFDFPVQRGAGGIEDYVHRIGRTARGGKESTGRSITYFTEGEDAPSARALVEVLEGAGQAVPSGLAAIVASQGDGSEIALATAQREAKKLAKKAAKVARPGDWQCPKCSARVFAKHSACFKCKTPKPPGAGEDSKIAFA